VSLVAGALRADALDCNLLPQDELPRRQFAAFLRRDGYH